jgi:DNA-binding transcriptional ArsR family regulator
LLNWAEDFTGLGEWVYRTVKTLSPEQLRTNEIVLLDAHVHLADTSWPSFPAWVDDLEARDPTQMRDRALQAWLAEAEETVDGEVPHPTELLADRAAYLSLVENHFRRREKPYDRSLWEQQHALLTDAPARQDLIVTHLRTMWDEVIAPEWERNLSMLQESVAAFESLDLSGLTAVQAMKRVIWRELPSNVGLDWLADFERVTFIPSVHNGPYVVRLGSLTDATLRLIYGARIPEGVPARMPGLSRSELLIRLNALADDTRLRILELLAREGELGTPDVKERLELSQSAASRHLEHLTATGYLIARSHRNTNLYQLNRDRIDQTFRALKEFCK